MSDAPYRDDRDADRARIDALEAELRQAKDKIEDLEGRRSQALVLASSTAISPSGKPSLGTRIAGAPMTLELTRTFDKPFPTEKFEDLVETMRGVTRAVAPRSCAARWRGGPARRSAARARSPPSR
jgi:hypothetical protein